MLTLHNLFYSIPRQPHVYGNFSAKIGLLKAAFALHRQEAMRYPRHRESRSPIAHCATEHHPVMRATHAILNSVALPPHTAYFI